MKLSKSMTISLLVLLSLVISLTILPDYLLTTHNVSIIPLINNSWFYHAKKVKTRGFLKLALESYYLHLDKESYQQSLYNSVWLGLDKEQRSNFLVLDKQYVEVEGTFSINARPRFPNGHGAIRVSKIKKIEPVQ
jgi:hypothetical protein